MSKRENLEKRIEVRVTEREFEQLMKYCAKVGRSYSDVIRGFIHAVEPAAQCDRLNVGKDPLCPTTAQTLRTLVNDKIDDPDDPRNWR